MDDENIETEEVEEKLVKEKLTERKPASKKNPFTVYRNEGKELVLVDSKGNGIRIPTPANHKNAKKGDIIYR
jgi:hypothetical protein